MYLPTIGSNRDRTSEFISFRGSSINHQSDQSSSFSDTDSLLRSSQTNVKYESPLQNIFELSNDIKLEISRIENTLDVLMKKQKEYLRPTFADSSDLIDDINTITNNINSSIQNILQKINFLDSFADKSSDRRKIIENLKFVLMENFNKFKFKFQMAQQKFSANFTKIEKKNQENNQKKEFELIDFGNRSETRQMQLENQKNNQEYEEIVQKATELRSLFMELSGLIVQQGSIIDRIDYNINESLTNAIEANKNIEKAYSYQKKSRMWICALILGVLVVLLLVMALLK